MKHYFGFIVVACALALAGCGASVGGGNIGSGGASAAHTVTPQTMSSVITAADNGKRIAGQLITMYAGTLLKIDRTIDKGKTNAKGRVKLSGFTAKEHVCVSGMRKTKVGQVKVVGCAEPFPSKFTLDFFKPPK